MLAAALALLACVCTPQEPLRLPLDAPDAHWRGAVPIREGAVGGAARFDGEHAHIDAGSCPAGADAPFTLRCRLRTTQGGFCTPLMARDGEQVALSLVLGREPGRVSFEAWSWQRVRLLSRVRVDDGAWHAVEVAYDSSCNTALLFVDGDLQSSAQLGDGAAAAAVLRLGNNIGAHQPYAGDLDEVEVARSAAHRELFLVTAPVLPLAERSSVLAKLREALLPRATPSLEPQRAGDWPARRSAVRAHVLDCLGLTPEPSRPPLDVQVHGTIEQDGIVIERISFQAFSGKRATGWLWRPAAAAGSPHPVRQPAMLCPHGHWQHGAREGVVQARCAAFAKFGWVTLAVDSSHAEAVAAGASPIGTMTWHNLRALDLLLERPDVDPARIGVTGCSGGGQQTYYLMAVDDRPAAAAPICMACYFAEIIADQDAHCGCNHLPRLAGGTDVPEMCAVFAPRPVFFGSVTGDWTATFPQRGLPELQRHWQQLGAAVPVQSLHRDEGHDYSQPMRERVYGFLQSVFATDPVSRPPTIAEPAFAVLPPERLLALGSPPSAQIADAAFVQQEVLARRAPILAPAALAPGLPWQVEAVPIEWRGAADQQWRPGSVRGSDGVPVPLQVRRSNAPADERWTVIVSGAGRTALLAAPPPWLGTLRKPVVVEARWFGEWQPFAGSWRRNGLMLGRGELYQGAHDVALACQSLPGTAPVTLVGLGAAGPTALVAAAICKRVTRLVTDDLGPDYAEQPNRTPLAPELLRFGGLLAFARQLDGRCEYVLGGAVRDPAHAGSPRRDLRLPLSLDELGRELSR